MPQAVGEPRGAAGQVVPARGRRGGGQLPIRLVVIAALAILGSLAIFSTLQIGPLKQRLLEKEQQLTATTGQRDSLQQQLAEVQEEQQRNEGRVTDLRTQLTAASGERDQLRAELEELRTRLQTVQEENARIQTQITELTKERDETMAHVKQLEQDKASLEQTTARLKNRLVFLDRDYRQLATLYGQSRQPTAVAPQASSFPGPRPIPFQTHAGEFPTSPSSSSSNSSTTPPTLSLPAPSADRPSIELAPIVVRRAQAEVMRSLRGRVVEVNDVHRFVVIDRGSSDGVQVGVTFDVLRGGASIGQIVVIRVQPRLSACEPADARSQNLPQVGDLVLQSGS